MFCVLCSKDGPKKPTANNGNGRDDVDITDGHCEGALRSGRIQDSKVRTECQVKSIQSK